MFTDKGRQIYNLVCDYGLGAYYNKYTGNIIIEVDNFTPEEYLKVLAKVMTFLRHNTDWVMGYENVGDDIAYVYVTTTDRFEG